MRDKLDTSIARPISFVVVCDDRLGLSETDRSQPACLQCHSKIDPWGVAFEEFDAGGRLKQQPADARSTLPDKTEVKGANDLKRYLGEDRIDQVAFSFLKHLVTYATGRTLTSSPTQYARPTIERLTSPRPC